MVDTRLALMGGSLDTATPITNASNQQYQNAMSHEQIIKQHYEALDTREKSRLSSTIAGAVQLKSFLDSDDLEGAHNFLQKRRQSLQSRIANGESIDTEETDAALDMLRRGNVDELRSNINGLMEAGKVYGILQSADLPSNIVEWQHYNAMSPEQQEQFLTMKRANPSLNLGGRQVIPSQVNPAGAPQASFEVTPKTTETPEYQRNVAKETAVGKGEGEATTAAKEMMTKMAEPIAAIEALKTSSKSAPGGVAQNIGAQLANKSGYGGEAAKAQGDFKVRRAAAENGIRAAFRVVGSGGQSDADAQPFIDMLPNAGDAEDVKIAQTDAALAAMKLKVSTLARERGLPDPFGPTNAPTTSGETPPVEGAQKAPDGNWYVKQGNQYYMVEQ